jgi:hypothetical protein
VRRPSGEIVVDPDQRPRATVRLVFDLLDRFKTVGKVMTYLIEHDIRMPVRLRGGAGKGELEWRRVSRPALLNLFAIRSMRASTLTACVRSRSEGKSPAIRRRDADRRAPKRPKSFCAISCPATSASSAMSAIRRS